MPAASTGGRGQELASGPAKVLENGLPGNLRDRLPAPSGFVPELEVKVIRKLNRGSSHDMPAYHLNGVRAGYLVDRRCTKRGDAMRFR